MSIQNISINRKVLKRFWNPYCSRLSKKLWMPTQLNGLKLDDPLFKDHPIQSMRVSNLIPDKKFNWGGLDLNNVQKNFKPIEQHYINVRSKTISQTWRKKVKCKPEDPKKKHKGLIRAIRIKIFLNSQQKELFKQCIRVSRYYYNKAIEEINRRYNEQYEEFNLEEKCIYKNCNNDKEIIKEEVKVEREETKEENEEGRIFKSFHCKKHKDKPIPWNLNISHISIRNTVLKTDEELEEIPENTEDKLQEFLRSHIKVPYDTRDLAIKEAVKAFVSSCALKKITNNSFKLKYRSRNKPTQTFHVNPNAYNSGRIFQTRLVKKITVQVKNRNGSIKYKSVIRENNSNLRTRKRVNLNSDKRYSLPEKILDEFHIQNTGKDWYLIYTADTPKEIIKPNNSVIALDPGVRTFLNGYSPDGVILKTDMSCLKKVNKFKAEINKLNSMISNKRLNKNKVNNKRIKLYKKIKDQVNNLHNQNASYLTKNYETIFLPAYKTSEMIQENLHKKTKNDMNALSSYRFQIKLKDLCEKRNKTLKLVTEEYTTKTCSNCGEENDPGYSKVYICSKCKFTFDRDINAARNIFIKELSRQYQINSL